LAGYEPVEDRPVVGGIDKCHSDLASITKDVTHGSVEEFQ
jgi:hypothetical protein